MLAPAEASAFTHCWALDHYSALCFYSGPTSAEGVLTPIPPFPLLRGKVTKKISILIRKRAIEAWLHVSMDYYLVEEGRLSPGAGIQLKRSYFIKQILLFVPALCLYPYFFLCSAVNTVKRKICCIK